MKKSKKDKAKLKREFKELKKKWLETNRSGDECIGNALEDYVGKAEDNKQLADYGVIELKSHRIGTNSKISLFSKSPSSSRGINSFIRKNYGYRDNGEEYNRLYVEASANKWTYNKNKKYAFKLKFDDENKKIFLLVKDSSGNIVEDEKTGKKGIFWSYTKIEEIIANKIKNIAIVDGKEKDHKGKHFVWFDSLTFVEDITFDNVINSLKKGKIIMEFRLGFYKSGKNEGKNHDHGSAFRIKKQDLLNIKK